MAEENKITHLPEPILESNGMRAIFQKNGGGGGQKNVKRAKKGKIFENILSKNAQNLKIFLKRARDCVRLSHVINC